MKFIILPIVIILVQSFTWVFAKGLYWLISPFWSIQKLPIIIGCFVLSNALLGSVFVGQFRLAMGWLALLWFVIMTSVAICGLSVIAHNIPPLLMRGLAVLGFGSIVAMALYNAYTPTVREITITTQKPLANPITLAMVSDLHLGRLFGSKQLYQLADILNEHKTDALLMPGDIMDDDTHIYDAQNMKVAFEAVVKASKGKVFASLGNHDLYNTQQRQSIAQAVSDTGAILLDDKVITTNINGSMLTIAGRFDDHVERLTTAELIKQADTTLPTILLDHRPSQIDDNVKLPIDLQVSGHTHNGQIFPANFIVKALNTVSYGHAKLNDTDVIVSSGYGFWGMPFRLGSQSEVWIIHLKSTKTP